MGLSFLPNDIKSALSHLNANLLTEIRLRSGRPVVIGYGGSYILLGAYGKSTRADDCVICVDAAEVLGAATGGNIFNYTEQIKSGFITVGHGVRIGIAGEYVTENGRVNTIKGVTSLSIRIPHDIRGCADGIMGALFGDKTPSLLIFSRPGLGKTTMLRDIARNLAADVSKTVLVLDERGEIAAMDDSGVGFGLGNADVIRCHAKLDAIVSSIRAMKPDVIITDELYGEHDLSAVKYAADCGISVIASSHVTDKSLLKKMPFDYFVCLTAVGQYEIYDKNFVPFGNSRADDLHRRVSVG